jgi:hypothetical protein
MRLMRGEKRVMIQDFLLAGAGGLPTVKLAAAELPWVQFLPMTTTYCIEMDLS